MCVAHAKRSTQAVSRDALRPGLLPALHATGLANNLGLLTTRSHGHCRRTPRWPPCHCLDPIQSPLRASTVRWRTRRLSQCGGSDGSQGCEPREAAHAAFMHPACIPTSRPVPRPAPRMRSAAAPLKVLRRVLRPGRRREEENGESAREYLKKMKEHVVSRSPRM